MRDGLVARYESEDALVAAIRRLRGDGYRDLDALMPFASARVIAALEPPRSPIPFFGLLGGVVGATGGYGLLYWTAVVHQPWNVGGRPLHSAPAFVPITFEVAVLGATLAIALVLFVLCRAPATSHPVLGVPGVERASDDAFFLVVDARDRVFDPVRTRRELDEAGALEIHAFGEVRS